MMNNMILEAHEQWAERPPDERFESLAELDEAVRRRRDQSREAPIAIRPGAGPASKGPLHWVDGEWWLEIDGGTCRLDGWPARQLRERLGIPRAGLDSPERALEAINERLLTSGFSSRAVVQYPDAPWRVIRGLPSDAFQLLRDSKLTGFLRHSLPNGWRNPVAASWDAGGIRPSGLYASARDLWAFFVSGGDMLDLGGRDQLHRGFFVWNSEVGDRDFGWSTFYFRRVCANHIVWGAVEQQVRQVRHDAGLDAGWKAFTEFIASLDHPSDDRPFVESVRAAKNRMVAPVGREEEAQRTLGDLGFTPGEIGAATWVMSAEEPEATGTAWDWLQGFTAVARNAEFVADRVELERRASDALLRGIAATPGSEARRSDHALV